jgi:hypothetical protein
VDINALVHLPVLSVRQPWASYIAGGLKSIELRSWASEYRGWLWIHASRQPDLEAMNLFKLNASEFPTGGLVGIAYLAACALIETPGKWIALRNEHRSPGSFSPGTYGWRFRDTVALREKITSRGELRLFSLDAPTQARVSHELASSAQHSEFVDTAADLPAA